jgi:hypothetical protein
MRRFRKRDLTKRLRSLSSCSVLWSCFFPSPHVQERLRGKKYNNNMPNQPARRIMHCFSFPSNTLRETKEMNACPATHHGATWKIPSSPKQRKVDTTAFCFFLFVPPTKKIQPPSHTPCHNKEEEKKNSQTKKNKYPVTHSLIFVKKQNIPKKKEKKRVLTSQRHAIPKLLPHFPGTPPQTCAHSRALPLPETSGKLVVLDIGCEALGIG